MFLSNFDFLKFQVFFNNEILASLGVLDFLIIDIISSIFSTAINKPIKI